jgi:hypothetical protein
MKREIWALQTQLGDAKVLLDVLGLLLQPRPKLGTKFYIEGAGMGFT